MRLSERLQIPPKFSDFRKMETGLELALRPPHPSCTDAERANKKFQIPFTRFFVSLACLYSDERSLAASHADKFIAESDEYLFGHWRSEFTTPDKIIDAMWWKRCLNWIDIFRGVLLWGSVLGEWKFLEKAGTFPIDDCHIDSGYGPQGRDLYVAFGAFLCESPGPGQEVLLERALGGPKKFYKLLGLMIRASVARDVILLQKSLTEFLQYYKKNEFQKESITAKISIEGTFFVHWAEKEKLPLTVPPEFEDHIVRLK
jgi:hypothetical protein